MALSRRDLLKLAPAGLLWPRRGRAASASDRKFLFILCYGGWDTSMLFTPLFDSPFADTEPDATTATAGGISFVDAEARPSVRSFFADHADRCCIINGIEARSITHEQCLRLILTGGTDTAADDWPSLLAGHDPIQRPLGHLVLYGPAISNRFTSRVVRVGNTGQLPDLLSGAALAGSDVPLPALNPSASDLEEAFLRQRLDHQIEQAVTMQGRALAGRYLQALEDERLLQALSGELDLAPGTKNNVRDLSVDAGVIFDAFSLGLSRCGMVQFDGSFQLGWDTHQDIGMQGLHFEGLFGYLRMVMADLDRRPGEVSASLADEVTIVVLSEMGRHPQYNSWGGKDHWTYTSAMLIGAGVAGGQAIGGLTEQATGRPVDLASGDLTDSGSSLVTGHLGATLLALGDVDPGGQVSQDIIAAALA